MPASHLLQHPDGANRAPTEIMAWYASADAACGRNEPCTCGSGSKWKHCHGEYVEAVA